MRAPLVALLASLVLGGCHLKEVPLDAARCRHDEIAWRADFAQAQADSVALSKPLLLVIVAGAKDDRC